MGSEKIRRIVRRKGKRVEITHTIGSYVSQPVTYEFLSSARAKAFEEEVSVTEEGYPIPVPFKYRDYLTEEPPPPVNHEDT